MRVRLCFAFLAAALFVTLCGCGGGGTPSPTPTNPAPVNPNPTTPTTPAVPLSVSPQDSFVYVGGERAFQVAGFVPGSGIDWSVSAGYITSTGLFVAPQTAGDVIITAQSVADPLRTGTVRVRVLPLVQITPERATLTLRGSASFGAQVRGISDNGVTWSVDGGDANGVVTQDGVYTAPNRSGIFFVRAISRANADSQATAIVIVEAGSGTVIIQ